MSRRFRVTANFPVLGPDAHQTVIVEGSNWQVALGKGARAFKRLTVMRRRRVTALSMMVEQMEGNGQVEDNIIHQPAAEQTAMEQPVIEDGESLNQAANEEAERLIAEGEEPIED